MDLTKFGDSDLSFFLNKFLWCDTIGDDSNSDTPNPLLFFLLLLLIPSTSSNIEPLFWNGSSCKSLFVLNTKPDFGFIAKLLELLLLFDIGIQKKYHYFTNNILSAIEK